MTSAGTDQVRWGFLGAGYVASRAVAPAVHASDHAQLQSVAARDAARASTLGPQGRAANDYRSVLDDDHVEAVYISLTNEAHLHWILAALAAGKHVLCEKPITLTAAECRTAFAAAHEAGLLLVEAAWTQWHPRTQRVNALIAAGELGEVHDISSAFTFEGVPPDNYRLDPTRGGGSLLDVGPYILRPAASWADQTWTVEVAHRQRSELGTDLRTSARLTTATATGSATAMGTGTRMQILSSFIDPEHQSLRIEGSAASVTCGPPAFTTWRAPADVEIAAGRSTWTESFPSCDAYELMVSSVSRRIRGDAEAFVIAEDETTRCMDLIDLVGEACSGAA